MAVLARDLVINLGQGIFSTVMIIALIFLALGLISWVVSYFVKTRKAAQKTEISTPTI
jgi:high-affinity Fe2+/Pb2+ permease